MFWTGSTESEPNTSTKQVSGGRGGGSGKLGSRAGSSTLMSSEFHARSVCCGVGCENTNKQGAKYTVVLRKCTLCPHFPMAS